MTTNKDKQGRPILTLGDKNKLKSDVTENRSTFVIEKVKKDTVESLSANKEKMEISDTIKLGAKAPENTTAPKANVRPKTEANAQPKNKIEPASALISNVVPAKKSVKTTAIDYDFKAIYNELHTKFPNTINMDKPVLLAIAIRGEMLKEVSAPNAVMYKWISWYFRKSNYYSLHKIGAMRYNLDGSESGGVTEKDQAKRDKQMGKKNNTTSQSQGSLQEKVAFPASIEEQ